MDYKVYHSGSQNNLFISTDEEVLKVNYKNKMGGYDDYVQYVNGRITARHMTEEKEYNENPCLYNLKLLFCCR